MAWRLKAADDLVAILMEGDPRVRVVLGLIRLMEIEGVSGKDGISFYIDTKDFATQIDVGLEVVHSIFKELTDKGIMFVNEGGSLVVKRPDELEEFYRFLELARKFGQK